MIFRFDWFILAIDKIEKHQNHKEIRMEKIDTDYKQRI